MMSALENEHRPLFQRLINRVEFTATIAKVFVNPRSQENAVKLLESLTSFLMKAITPSNLYEHPIAPSRPFID